MAKHFVSILGTSTYAECIYHYEGQEVVTSFVQEASIIGMGPLTQEDRITIFVTQGSKKCNWEDRIYTEADINALQRASKGKPVTYKVGDKKVGLKSILEQKYGNIVEEVMIKDGRNKEEQEEIFDKIYDCLNQKEEVYFDITHGFRTIPMLAITVLNYAKVLKDIDVKGILYGAYEPQGQVKEGLAYVPIIEYSIYMDILEWSAAANSFIRYGNSGQIGEIYQKLKKQEMLHNKETPLLALKDSIQGICNLTRNIATCRGKYIDKGNIKRSSKVSIKGAYEYFKNSIQHITSQQKKVIKPFEQLLYRIEQAIDQVFKDKDTPEQVGLATVKWCIDNNLIQQGFTALEETLTTYVCRKYGFNYNDRIEREQVSRNIISYAIQKIQDKELEPPKEAYRHAAETFPKELAELAKNIKKIRNNINHFGYNDPELKFETLEKSLEKYYNKLIKLL